MFTGAVVQAVRHRRRLVAAAGTAVALGVLVPMGAIVLAVGGAPETGRLTGATDIPPIVLDAYQRAATDPSLPLGCTLRWQVLAGIGKVESDHATGRGIDPNGTVAPPIVGVPLDGTNGTARVPDTDGGRFDADTTWDRAVGPLQFIPTSWETFGVDGNGDGISDPHNVYDAALAAAGHLCGTTPGDYSDDEVLSDGLYAYNHSQAYVDEVTRWVHHYDATGAGSPGRPASPPTGDIVTVGGIEVDSSIAADLDALLEAAAAAGHALGGGGYRSHEQQIALRRAHCGTSYYAIYEMPPADCTPPTAIPGTSMHEVGLAIDFTCDGVLIDSQGDACFEWLAANASLFGLTNLPSEPWHWSTTGH